MILDVLTIDQDSAIFPDLKQEVELTCCVFAHSLSITQ